uniref:Uncharacterized protein n=1 Tax=Anguilla anguilla TaxID=7936 RepID=A0A0E9VPZ8_ANGAN
MQGLSGENGLITDDKQNARGGGEGKEGNRGGRGRR